MKYTENLKNDIKSKLLDNNQTFINKWIYRVSYIEQNNVSDLIKLIHTCTSWLNTHRLDERIYVILNDIVISPICYCGNTVKFKRFGLGYAQYCSVKCRANDGNWQQQVANTNLIKYGVTHIAQLSDERINRKHRFEQVDRTNWDTEKQARHRKQTIISRYGETYNAGWTEQAIQTRIDNGHMVPIELLDEYREYYNKVVKYTEKQNLSIIPNIDKRGVLGKDDDAHHVDHMVSIYDGFMNDIPHTIIGHITNLQCIPGRLNIQKGNDSSLQITQLIDRYNEWEN